MKIPAARVFLSYSTKDRAFARKLRADLEERGAQVWVDEERIGIGEGLVGSIGSALENVDFVAIILSPNAIESRWVARELEIATTVEIETGAVKVLPLLYKHCSIPGGLKGRRYADFTSDGTYSESLRSILKQMHLIAADDDEKELERFYPPYHFEQFVEHLLTGQSDDLSEARNLLQEITSESRELGRGFEDALEVFELRHRLNMRGEEPDPAVIRQLQRALEGTLSPAWKEHPLRYHALGELYSIYAQSSRARIRSSRIPPSIRDMGELSVSWYAKVETSASQFVSQRLRQSAILNSGNVYYYLRDFEKAVEIWRRANSPPNTSAWGNLIAGLIQSGRTAEAITEALEAITWSRKSGKSTVEPSQYSSILSHLAFAYWMEEKGDLALDYAEEALAVQTDLWNEVNFAFALWMAGEPSRCVAHLRRFFEPLSANNQAAVVAERESDARAYFVWFLADADGNPPVQAARLFATMTVKAQAAELEAHGHESVGKLIETAEEHLKREDGMCSSFLQIPRVKSILEERKRQAAILYGKQGGQAST